MSNKKLYYSKLHKPGKCAWCDLAHKKNERIAQRNKEKNKDVHDYAQGC